MYESLLHYVWQHQYFSKEKLATANGDELVVRSPGYLNNHAGPDFHEARLRIGEVEWAGQVEIHIKASDWLVHGHQEDEAYENVILHVVWDNDTPITRRDGSLIPVLVLGDRTPPDLVRRYRQLLTSSFLIPCETAVGQVPALTLLSMKERAANSRLRRKSIELVKLLKGNGGDWEETTYQVLARNFGFKVNAEGFSQLCRTVSLLTLRKCGNLEQTEALLLGQAGFLDDPEEDPYHQKLRKEYQYLSHKFGLSKGKLHRARWRFLRLRPANFPTLRIAQFAAMIQQTPNLLSSLTSVNNLEDARMLFQAPVSPYWQKHYRFNTAYTETGITGLGDDSIRSLVINTICTLLTARGLHTDDNRLEERALHLMSSLPPEENSIITHWKTVGMVVENALDSQGLLEQYHFGCQRRQCLQCPVGAWLTKPD